MCSCWHLHTSHRSIDARTPWLSDLYCLVKHLARPLQAWPAKYRTTWHNCTICEASAVDLWTRWTSYECRWMQSLRLHKPIAMEPLTELSDATQMSILSRPTLLAGRCANEWTSTRGERNPNEISPKDSRSVHGNIHYSTYLHIEGEWKP